MKIEIYTADAAKLKAKILNDARENKLATWKCASGKSDVFLTHTPDQWVDKVILQFLPSENNTVLSVCPTYWNGRPVPTGDEIGTIMGRFSERLWIQYRADFSSFESVV